jgi:hypothetical protein
MRRLLAILALILLAGCGAETTVETSGTSERSDLDSLLAASEEATLARKVLGKSTNIESTMKKVNPGDYVVFGILVNNPLSKTETFVVDAEFFEARDNVNNKIEMSEAEGNAWLGPSNFNEFTLEPKESKYVPVIIKVGEDAQRGSYKFNVIPYRLEDGSQKDHGNDWLVFVSVQ